MNETLSNKKRIPEVGDRVLASACGRIPAFIGIITQDNFQNYAVRRHDGAEFSRTIHEVELLASDENPTLPEFNAEAAARTDARLAKIATEIAAINEKSRRRENPRYARRLAIIQRQATF
jgi:hypothetical protein